MLFKDEYSEIPRPIIIANLRALTLSTILIWKYFQEYRFLTHLDKNHVITIESCKRSYQSWIYKRK